MVLVVDSQEPKVQVVIGNVLEEAGSGVNSVSIAYSVSREPGLEMKGGSRVERYIVLNVL